MPKMQATNEKTKNGNPRGRPKLEFDLNQIKLFGQFKATFETMAEWYGCSTQTITRKMKEEEFSQAYKKGFSVTKMKISEAQIKYALQGNPTLLIWVGKQYLGQRDTTYEISEPIDLKEFAEVIANNYEPEAT